MTTSPVLPPLDLIQPIATTVRSLAEVIAESASSWKSLEGLASDDDLLADMECTPSTVPTESQSEVSTAIAGTHATPRVEKPISLEEEAIYEHIDCKRCREARRPPVAQHKTPKHRSCPFHEERKRENEMKKAEKNRNKSVNDTLNKSASIDKENEGNGKVTKKRAKKASNEQPAKRPAV